MKPISSKNDYVLIFVGIFFVLLFLFFAMPRSFPKLKKATQGSLVFPSQSPSADQKQQQLQWFTFQTPVPIKSF